MGRIRLLDPHWCQWDNRSRCLQDKVAESLPCPGSDDGDHRWMDQRLQYHAVPFCQAEEGVELLLVGV